ncbi:MAG: hypothetical protein ABUL77_00680 [Bacteroidota bacterium]
MQTTKVGSRVPDERTGNTPPSAGEPARIVPPDLPPDLPPDSPADSAYLGFSPDQKAGTLTAITKARQSSAGRQAARLEQITAQLRRGVYALDLSRVAQQLMAEGDVDSRLRSLLA